MLQHALIPFGVEHPCARFKVNLFAQGANLGVALGCIHHIDWAGLAARLFNGLAHAAQAIDIMVDVGDASFDRLQILIGQFDACQLGFEQGAMLDRRTAATVSKTLFRFEHIGEFFRVSPCAAIDHHIDVGTVSALRVGEDPQRRGFKIASMLRLMGKAMFADEIGVGWLVGHCRQIGRIRNHAGLQRQ